MKPTFTLNRRIEFSETDLAGFAHFSSYLKYMEETEHAFLRTRGLAAALQDEKGTLGFPKVTASCNYLIPATYDDLLEINMTVRCKDGKLLVYDYGFGCRSQKVATGQLRVACCRFPGERRPYAVPVPDDVLKALFQ